MEQAVQQVAQALSQGADPNQIMQQLMQQGNMPQEQAAQIIQAAMQMLQGGEQEGVNMQGTMYTQRESQQLIETALGELGPEVLFALLQAYDRLDDANKSALMQQLQQMAGSNTRQASSGNQEQEAPETSAVESNLFGRA